MRWIMALTWRRPRPTAAAALFVLLLAVLVPVRLGLVRSAAAPSVTVNSTGDAADTDAPGGPFDEVCSTGATLPDGTTSECTLRAAIQTVNGSAVDTILFDVPEADANVTGGVVTITPGASLPAVTSPVVIDGASQPTFAGTPVVAIDGSAAGDLLDLAGGSSTVRSLSLYGSADEAINIRVAGGNTIVGNWIGVLPDGVTSGGLGDDGIAIRAGADGNVVGGADAADGNVVADVGGDGLFVLADSTTIRNNRVGTWPDGTPTAGAGRDGIRLDGANGTVLLDNTITDSGADGVNVVSGTGNTIRGNSIVANTGLGIDLGTDGVATNDAGDLDTGANDLLNHPVATEVTPDRALVELDVPGDVTVEVFRNPNGTDPSGFGEGEQLVATAAITHAGAGPELHEIALTGVGVGDELTFTATEDLGGTDGSTSEFSAVAPVAVAVVNSTGDLADTTPGDGACATLGPAVGGVPECTLRAAIQEANASVLSRITFAVPASDVGVAGGIATIAPGTDLPPVTAPTELDATTQTGFGGTPVVELDGSGAAAAPGLHLTGGRSSVRGLAVHSFAGAGIHLDGASEVTVAGNHVGTDGPGTADLGNGGAGIVVSGATTNAVLLGGTTAADGNLVTHNGGDGIEVGGAGDPTAVSILGNAIVGNDGLGIDLLPDGVTANDVDDVDSGPNDLLNRPVVTAATDDRVEFDLDVPAGTYRVEVFRNPTEGADPTGAGEGEQLVGTTTVTHDGTADGPFSATGLTDVVDLDELSLTATEDLGTTFGSTSEFSATVTADDHLAIVTSSGDGADATPGDGVCATAGGDCTLRAAIQEAGASTLVDEVWFDVPAADPGVTAGVLTIAPATALPAVGDGTTIDGTTQPGYAAAPVVAIDGSGLPPAVASLAVTGTGVELRALSVHGGTGHGIEVTGADVTITDSRIGLRPDATVDGHAGDGLRVDGAVGVLVLDSEVVGNGGNGVTVVGAADDVAVVGTPVHDNVGLGIDLGGDGVTADDPGDGDGGPNGLLNRPVVTGVAEAAGTVTLQVALDVPVATGNVLLQVHTTDAPDPSGAGEGGQIVHTQVVDVSGGAGTTAVSFPGDLTRTFTVTATEDLGGGAYGATSEFSATATRPVAADDPGSVPTELATAGALSHWRLGEAVGPTATDSGPTGADGTYRGDPTLGADGVLAGDVDTAVDLDGSDDAMVAPHDPAHLLDAGAVSLWVNLDVLGSTVFSKDAAGAGQGGHTSIEVAVDGTVTHRLADTTGEVVLTSSAGAVTTGAWHHLAVTFGPRGAELWVDADRVAQDPSWTTGWGASAGGTGNTEPIVLGAGNSASPTGTTDALAQFTDGRLDEVAVLDGQVDGATIARIAGAAPQDWAAASGVPLTVPASGGVLTNDHDADGEALSASTVTAPANASAFLLEADGGFSYTSTPGFVGTDTFTYAVSDGVATSAPATVTVTVSPARGARVITDSTGNGHEGRPAGDMTTADQVDGKVGGALEFDGADDRIEVDNLDVAGDRLTISAWVQPTATTADATVVAKAVGLGDLEWRLQVDAGGAAGGAAATGAGTVATAGGGVTAGVWAHVVARYDGSAVTLFVDGARVATAPHSGDLQPDPRIGTWIGAHPDGGNAFGGRIDEVRVSSVARSDAWIAADHATQDAPGTAVTVGTVQTEASDGWTTTTGQARSGSASALAPSGVLRSWLTLDGVDEVGLEATAWWRVTDLGLDVAQGVRAGDAAGPDPRRQDETALTGAAGWDLGQLDGTRTQLAAPPAGQAPAVDTWQRVTVRIDQADALSATAAGFDVPLAAAGVLPSGSIGLRADGLPLGEAWWVDDLRLRRYVTPEPVATLRRTELAP